MAGGYIICELKSVQREWPEFQRVFASLESEMIAKCEADWKPMTYGGLSPSKGQFGRTTILPPLFKGADGSQLVHWRQLFTSTGHQLILAGVRSGNVIPEDFKVGWIGLAFPNKEQVITEIKWQIGDKKYGRINLEDLRGYKTPAVVFERGFIIDEETSFELYAYVENATYCRIVPLGFCCYRRIDKVLGSPGSAI